jgi:hypothetical protein
MFHGARLKSLFPVVKNNVVSIGAVATNLMVHLFDFLAAIDFTPVKLYPPKTVVDDALAYAMPPIITFCTAAVSWKILLYFIHSAKGD